MEYTGDLGKMQVLHTDPVDYRLILGNDEIRLNDLIGSKIQFAFSGEIHCILCGQQTNRSFAQGFCFTCFSEAPESSECIIHPELCEGHLGMGRDPEWERLNHATPHYVYLALTSSVKVGVTREANIPYRWIDQGAWKVILLAETPNRRMAGEIEVFLKKFVADRTHWQKMLRNIRDGEIDLKQEKERIFGLLPAEFAGFYSGKDEILEFNYPVAEYPDKVKSLNFDNTPEIEGVLKGIRGQYLIFEEGRVLNIRKFNGYRVGLWI